MRASRGELGKEWADSNIGEDGDRQRLLMYEFLRRTYLPRGLSRIRAAFWFLWNWFYLLTVAYPAWVDMVNYLSPDLGFDRPVWRVSCEYFWADFRRMALQRQPV